MKKLGILYSILALLLASCGRADRMRHMLEQAEWMNRHDSLFTSDSVGRALVRYYDHWWHPADLRLRAYYMLGCAYRDMGEAPAAIHYYTIATEKVDTAHADSATYATLFRVYGQMAMIYGQQNMPEEKKEALSHYGHYAWLAHDTLNYIISYEQMTDVCYQLDDTLGVYAYTDTASMLYLKYINQQMAASVYPTAIYVSLLNGDYMRAHHYMNIFEKKSGLFDESGNIQTGREHYYNSRGLYYLGINQLDSAEYWFRRLQQHGYYFDSYKGLLSVFQKCKDVDSITKYSKFMEESLISWTTEHQANAIIHSAAIYKYERNKILAEKDAKDARISHQIIALMVTILFILALLAYIFLNRIKLRQQKREEEYQTLVREHEKAKEDYRHQYKNLTALQLRYDSLQKHLSEVVTQKNTKIQEQIEQMQNEIDCQKQLLNSYRDDVIKKESELKQEDIVILFQSMAQKRLNGRIPNTKDWNKLFGTYKRFLPHMYARLKIAKLSQQEMRTALLTHLEATPTDLMVLLNTSKSTISNAKSDANLKLFGQKDATSLMSNLKKCAYFE